MTAYGDILDSLRVSEDTVRARMDSLAGGRSMCSLFRAGVSVPGAKYREGEAAALVDAHRAFGAFASGDDGAFAARAAMLDVRARWSAQIGTRGRTGQDWADYLRGGLDALDRALDDGAPHGRSRVAD